ncbi:hypothetical protein EJ05DRAFT_153087 [Pseudovirgaria hyperparasitica]|uniref:Sterol-4-alpha-carboxylate 3-dehydrogenase ERG26, decarboxylating n=1 Tax=Pseudovirgaria hyperparasitica TaxID=470096 RepID=A0A6A6VX72_9PEZI|nr:uncharacterized protein EJ05DRAFT_153087 [Pseudovirgaria hyperparasitica]KAF2754230.1 hypothetical protein EJ05DRAFT_153087 [Pseudovirgaria hyperparasitica]
MQRLLSEEIVNPQQRKRSTLGNVCVVGGCGFLGHHIVRVLLEQFPDTRIFVLDLRTESNRNSSPQVSYHAQDITDTAKISELFQQFKLDVVIHTASPVPTLPKKLLYKVNVEGTKALLQAAQETGVKAFVYTSSASVICDPETGLINADERYPMVLGDAQSEYYTSTKGYAEIAVTEANRKTPGFFTCALRPAGIFGEGDRQNVSALVKAYRERSINFQVGDNQNLFDFTYVGNLAHAHILAATALMATHEMMPTVPLDTEKVDGEAFFITNDEPVYFWDYARASWRECGPVPPPHKVWVLPKGLAYVIATILETILGLFGKQPNLTRQRVNYLAMTRYYNITKAKTRLGYRPIVPLQEGIKRGVAHALAEEEKAAGKKG